MTKKVINQTEAETPVENNVEAPVINEAKNSTEDNSGKVGALLKEKRMSQDLKLTDVAQKLCIRRVYLEAIEESRYSELPDFPYGIGFIRSYADFLGLNGHRIVQMYKDETEANNRKNNDYFVFEPQAEATAPSHKYLLVSLLALILIYAVWHFIKASSEEAEETVAIVEVSETAPEEVAVVIEDYSANTQTDTTETTEVSQVTITDEKFVEPVATTVVEEKKEEVVAEEPKKVEATKTEAKSGMVVNVKEETWVEVRDANKLYISKVLQAGDSYAIPQGEGMILSVGKYNGVEVLLDGKAIEVVKPNKKMNIKLDSFLKANH